MCDVVQLPLTIAVDTARRLSPDAVEAAVAEARQTDDPSFTNWRAAGLWGGYAGLAVLAASLDAVEPGSGWDSIGFDHLRRAVRAMEAEQSPAVGMAGLAGLATSASLLSRDGSRYETLLTSLESAIVERVEHMSQGVLQSRPHGVPVGLFDVIIGLAGAGRYLLGRAQSAPCRRALETLLSALVYLSEADADAVPHWHTTFHHATDNLRKFYPDGHVNLGLAHGIPGPLALLSLSASQGVEVAGQHDAIVRIADRIVQAQCSDEWGVGFPVAASILHGLQGRCECGRSERPCQRPCGRAGARGVVLRPARGRPSVVARRGRIGSIRVPRSRGRCDGRRLRASHPEPAD